MSDRRTTRLTADRTLDLVEENLRKAGRTILYAAHTPPGGGIILSTVQSRHGATLTVVDEWCDNTAVPLMPEKAAALHAAIGDWLGADRG